MARGINKVILIGNLGADPEVRFMPSGGAVANVRVATNETWKDRQSGEQQERTEWHRVVLFGQLGELAQKYLRKGSRIYIEGRLQTRKWQGQDGQDRYATEIVANDMQMLDRREGEPGGTGSQTGDEPNTFRGPPSYGDEGTPSPARESRGGGRTQSRAPASAPPPDTDPNDDIPF